MSYFLPAFLGLNIVGFSMNYYYKKNLEFKQIQNSLYYKTVLNLAYLDPQFTNICGNNIQVKNAYFDENLGNSMILKINFNGVKGDSTLVVKLNQVSHENLVENNYKQSFYSTLTREEKSKVLFVPWNLSDILIPTDETISRLKSNKKINDYLEYIFTNSPYIDKKQKNDIDKYLKDTPNDEIFKLQNTDKFWKINTIILTSNDNTVYSIRPLSYRRKQIHPEDTFYTYDSLLDSLRQIELNIINCISQNKEKSKISTMKTELQERKELNFVNNQQKRKKIILFLSVGFCFGLFIYSFFNRKRIDVSNLSKINVIVNSNEEIKKIIGNSQLMFCKYKYLFNSDNYELKFFVQGEKGHAKLKCDAEYNEVSRSFIITSMKFDMQQFSNSQISEILINKTFIVGPDDIKALTHNLTNQKQFQIEYLSSISDSKLI